MAQLDAALRTRAGKRSWLTRAADTCNNLTQTNVAECTKEIYDAAISNFDRRLAAWDEAEEEVEALVPLDQIEEEIASAADFRDSVEAAKIDLMTSWSRTHTYPGSNTSTAEINVAEKVGMKANLPKLDLPKFHGEILKFAPFWQQFEVCIDQENMPSVMKFNYLMGLLRGDAKSLLDGLPVTEENYGHAKELLVSKYGRKEVIIFAHIQELLATEIPEATDTAKLSKAYDVLMSNVRALEPLGVTANQFGVVLTPIIVSRLPEVIRLEWARLCDKKEADLTFLLHFMEREIQQRERCQTFGGLGRMTTERKVTEKQPKPAHHSKPTAAALHSGSSSSSSSPSVSKMTRQGKH